MVWKPREKELTHEEAVAAAKKELAPFWFGSQPVFAAFLANGLVSVHPLTLDFQDFTWVVFYIDPTVFAGKMALNIAREFFKRYSDLNIKVVAVLKPSYSYFKDLNAINLFIHTNEIEFPIVLDVDTLLSQAFRVQNTPKLIVLGGGKIVFEKSGSDWFDSAELELQKYLRSKEIGLPLLPLYKPQFHWNCDIAQIDFSLPQSKDTPYSLGGTWTKEGDKIVTKDVNAKVQFNSPATCVSVIAQSVLKSRESTKIIVEVEGIPVADVFSGAHLSYDDEGQSYIRVEEALLYVALMNLPKNNREITLRFPLADRIGVVLYGIRFSE
ncbi:MAG: hypothetical protein HY072_02055 [Deltaproteobacteria bacterium]|nr:hypothetical protein [Deltaproteobacteria bacterium]